MVTLLTLATRAQKRCFALAFAKIVLLFHYFSYFCGAFSEMWCLGAEFVFDYMVLPDSKFRTEDEICITT